MRSGYVFIVSADSMTLKHAAIVLQIKCITMKYYTKYLPYNH